MSERTVSFLLDDINEAIERIEKYINGLRVEEFKQDEKTADAVVRNLEIIGEAANRLPENYTQQYSNVEWRKIIGLRHRIVHEYFGVDLDIIWQIIKVDLPAFKKNLSKIYR